MTDIRELKFSIRTRNLLLNIGIDTVEKLLETDLERLRKEHMVGPITMAEIDRKIREFTEGMKVEEENEHIFDLLMKGLKLDESLEVTKSGKAISVVMPSGRHIVIRVEG